MRRIAAVVIAGLIVAARPSGDEPAAGPSEAHGGAGSGIAPIGRANFEPELLDVSDDERELTVRWSSGGCYEFDRLDVTETSTEVRITSVLKLPITQAQGAGQSPPTFEVHRCDPMMFLGQEVIELEQPLGDREIRVSVRTEHEETDQPLLMIRPTPEDTDSGDRDRSDTN